MTAKDTKKAATAVSDFLAVSSIGGLPDLGVDEAVQLAKDASGDPKALGLERPEDVQEAMLGSYFGALGDAEVHAANREAEMGVARMRTNRWNMLFRMAGIDPDGAARMTFDRENGDPSAMLKVKERYYFG